MHDAGAVTTSQATTSGADEEASRRAKALLAIMRAILLAIALIVPLAALDPRNDVRVSFVLWLPVVGGLLLGMRAVRRGSVRGPAWGVTLLFWAFVTAVMVFFGGLRGHNAIAYVVGLHVAGSTLGVRAAVGVALASSVSAGLVAWAEAHDLLPPPLAPYSGVNAWIAVAVSLLLAAILLNLTLTDLRSALAESRRNAAERDAAQAKFLSTQKMEAVGRFSSGIAHDFNNLLTVIGGATELLRDHVPESDAAASALLDSLREATARATLMTRQLLAFGRARGEAIAPLDFAAVVRSSAPLLARLLGDEYRLVTECPAGEVVARGSRVGLEQILLNLVANARDAMPAGGPVTLVLRREHGRVVLEVGDRGAGIPDEARGRLFEPFFTTKAAGTGLGLATVHDIVQLFGGSIEIDTAPGNGTRFLLRFDAVVRTQTGESAANPNTGGGPSVAILLAEDDAAVRAVLVAELERAGHRVTAVESGGAALERLRDRPPVELVVTDVAMAGLGGIELARRLDAEGSLLPVLFLSGHANASELPVLRMPFRFLPKPPTRAALLQAIRELVHEARATTTPAVPESDPRS